MDIKENIKSKPIRKDSSNLHSTLMMKDIDSVYTSSTMDQLLSTIGCFDYDVVEDETFWSNQVFTIFDINNDNSFVPTYETLLTFIHPDDQSYYDQAIKNALHQSKSYSIEYRIVDKNSVIKTIREQANIIVDENGNSIRIIGTVLDILKIKKTEKLLLEKEQPFEAFYHSLDTAVWSMDANMEEWIFCSNAMENITGFPADLFLNYQLSWIDLIHPLYIDHFYINYQKVLSGQDINMQYKILCRNGEEKWIQERTTPVLNEKSELIRLDGIISDITEKKQIEDKINKLAFLDDITGLPNRITLEKRIESQIQELEGSLEAFALLLIDMDRFRQINDSFCRAVGDQLIKQIAFRLTECVGEKGFVARMVGDEFCILLPNVNDIDAPVKLAETVTQSLRELFIIDNYELYVTASIGISMYPHDGKTSESLLSNTDVALNRAKKLGRNTVKVYSPSMSMEAHRVFKLEKDLRKAISNQELFLVYQPIVDANTNMIKSAEALIRWAHPELGIIPPSEFIPLAEENGFILEITDWTLQTACHQMNQWRQLGLPLVPISVNISAKRLLRNDFKEMIKQILIETKINPSYIELEITESTLIKNEQVIINRIEEIKKLGVRLALDDFGTGYSSLIYLKQFKVDTIKIDRLFIQDLLTSDAAITKSIIYLAKGLNMSVIAEGVETKEQLNFLRDQNCHYIQGYLYSKPVSSDDFQNHLQNEYIAIH